MFVPNQKVLLSTSANYICGNSESLLMLPYKGAPRLISNTDGRHLKSLSISESICFAISNGSKSDVNFLTKAR